MSELVTKEFLKAFGDKCKKIFKCQTKVATVSQYEQYYYAIIKTDLPFGQEWSIHMDISGKGQDIINPNTGGSEYSGDIKFFCNMSNKYPPIGRGYSLVDNEILGVGISSYEAEGSGTNENNQCFIVHFSKPVHQIAVDVFNYGGQFSTINITDIQFVNSIDGLVYNHVLGSIPNMINESIGEIIRLQEQEELKEFSIEIPSMDDSSISGYNVKVPSEKSYIPKVNSSKWSDYLQKQYNIILQEGDLKLSNITFGGNNKTEISIPSLEINNSVQGNTEGEWFGKVQVNSKGLVTAVGPEEPLQVATDTTLGGIQIGYEQDTIKKKYPVSIDENNKAYVHVPWNDTDTWNKVADDSNLGLIKIGYTENGKNYPVQLDYDNRAFVSVPWTDSKCETATETQLGSIKVGYTTTDKNYAVQLDSEGNAYVNVPLEPGETYDKATRDTLGLVKLGGSSDWFKSPLELELDGSAYVILCKKPFTTEYSSGNSSSSIPQYGDHSVYRHAIITSEEPYTYMITIKKETNSYFLGTKNVVYRIDNKSQNPATIKVGCAEGVSISNMFDAMITSGSGLELPAGKTLELVFTYWDLNDVSFNGGFSV